jgi:hypothetical protein
MKLEQVRQRANAIFLYCTSWPRVFISSRKLPRLPSALHITPLADPAEVLAVPVCLARNQISAFPCRIVMLRRRSAIGRYAGGLAVMAADWTLQVIANATAAEEHFSHSRILPDADVPIFLVLRHA